MKKWSTLLKVICFCGLSVSAVAQEQIIDNGRTNIIINTTWGDTYVGKYTSSNGLVVENGASLTTGDAYVGFTNTTSGNEASVAGSNSIWKAKSLQVGTANNSGNAVIVEDYGTLEISGDLTINGAGNGNALTLATNGTLSVGGDLDASMAGLTHTVQTTLKVGGDLSGLDAVEGQRTVELSGADSQWILGGSNLTVGGVSGTNTVALGGGAAVVAETLSLGAGGSSNTLSVTGGSSISATEIEIGSGGDNNALSVSSGKIIAANLSVGDGGHSNTFSIASGAFGSMTSPTTNQTITSDSSGAITNVTIITPGEVGSVTNLTITSSSSGTNTTQTVTAGGAGSIQNLTIGAGGNYNTVTVGSAALAVGNLRIGQSTTSNALILTSGGQVTLSGTNTIDSGNTLQVESGGRLITESDFDATVAGFQLMNGGTLEAHKKLMMTGIAGGGAVELNGADARLNQTGSFNIGSVSSGNSSLLVYNGAVAQVGSLQLGSPTSFGNMLGIASHGNFIIEEASASTNYSGNVIHIFRDGRLTIKSNWSDTLLDGAFTIDAGAILEFQGEAPILTNWNTYGEYLQEGVMFLGRSNGEEGYTFILNGSNAALNAAALDLHIGDASYGNTLVVTNGAQVEVKSMSIGAFSEYGYANWVFIGGEQGGSNAVLKSTGDVSIGGIMLEDGSWNEGGVLNAIQVSEGGELQVGGTLHNRNNTGFAGIVFEPGARVTATNYYQSYDAILNYVFDQAGMTNAGILEVANVAEFETGANIQLSNIGIIDRDTFYTNTLVTADTLIVDGVTNATSADLRKLDTISGSLIDAVLMAENDDIIAILNRAYLSDSAGFSRESQMGMISEGIDQLSLTGDAAAMAQVDILNGMSGAQQRKELEQLYARNAPTFQHGRGIVDGIKHVQLRSTAARRTRRPARKPAATRPAATPAASEAAPEGPAGPHAEDQELRGWANGYGSMGAFNGDNGYDMQTYGTIIGIDRSFGEWLFGLAGGYAGSNLETDGGDESDADTKYGVFYTSYGTEEVFGDLVLSYGKMDIDNTSGTSFDVESETEADQYTVYIGGGKEEVQPAGSSYILRTDIGMLIGLYDQDGYTEKSSNAVTKEVDSFDRWSYRSNLGVSVITPKKYSGMDLETIVRFSWQHEFNDDEQDVDYSLSGSNQKAQMVMLGPDSDYLGLGLGVSASWKNGFQLKADVDGQASENTASVLVSGSLLYEF